jgi:peptide-methionine (S)-S-oxide reductase
MTGHNEVVLVVYDPSTVSLEYLLKVFWQGHNPTLGMRQGNDMGTQYRSGIYWFDEEQRLAAVHSAQSYQAALDNTCPGKTITTEILAAQEFYYAEPYHQQYLIKNPGGYCPDISCQATGLPTFPS